MTSRSPHSDRAALLVIDVQKGFDDAAHWGPRNNPACEANIGALLAAWRAGDRPVVLVRHDSASATSPLRAGQSGNDLKSVTAGARDLVVTKTVHSAFHGHPNLDDWLRARGVGTVVISGITTNHCCETTARVAADIGYSVLFALDATHTFDRAGPDGSVIAADDLARTTATNLDGEFATVVSTVDLVS